jgi:PII-like signaling protein
MTNLSEATILRIFIGSTDQVNHQPLYEYLVFEAKKQGLAGATVVKGMMSFGASSVIHSYKFWEVNEKVPVVVEIVDEERKIQKYFDSVRGQLETMKYGCLVTMDKTNVLLYKSGTKRMFNV